MPVPKPPSTAAVEPFATGSRRSRTRWPVTSGTGASSRLPWGRGVRTGHRSVMVTVTPSTVAIGSSGPKEPGGREPADRAGQTGGNGDRMCDAAGVGRLGEHRTGGDGLAEPRPRLDHPLPFDRPERAGSEPLGPVEQGPQQAVEHAAEQPWSERCRERAAVAEDGSAGPYPARVLVDLDDDAIPRERDHLARQPALTDLHEVEQPHRPGQALDVEQRAVDAHHATGRRRLRARGLTPTASRRRRRARRRPGRRA